jgi:hypothetical protein
MMNLSHRVLGLSMAVMAAAVPAAARAPGTYVGRWTVADDKPAYSARGLLYQTVDIALCGKDYCGVSVGKDGACGPVMFRFLAKSLASEEGLSGHGRWGNAKKNIELYAFKDPRAKGGRTLMLALGDGHNFNDRGGNMPMFSAGYRAIGVARCVAR